MRGYNNYLRIYNLSCTAQLSMVSKYKKTLVAPAHLLCSELDIKFVFGGIIYSFGKVYNDMLQIATVFCAQLLN